MAASWVESPASISSYYNDMIKNEDKSDFKLPSELTVDEFINITPKLNGNLNVKYSAINMISSEAPYLSLPFIDVEIVPQGGPNQ